MSMYALVGLMLGPQPVEPPNVRRRSSGDASVTDWSLKQCHLPVSRFLEEAQIAANRRRTTKRKSRSQPCTQVQVHVQSRQKLTVDI